MPSVFEIKLLRIVFLECILSGDFYDYTTDENDIKIYYLTDESKYLNYA